MKKGFCRTAIVVTFSAVAFAALAVFGAITWSNSKFDMNRRLNEDIEEFRRILDHPVAEEKYLDDPRVYSYPPQYANSQPKKDDLAASAVKKFGDQALPLLTLGLELGETVATSALSEMSIQSIYNNLSSHQWTLSYNYQFSDQVARRLKRMGKKLDKIIDALTPEVPERVVDTPKPNPAPIQTNSTSVNSTRVNPTTPTIQNKTFSLTNETGILPQLTSLGITLSLEDPETLEHFVKSGMILSVNQTKGFSLQENPSTGYMWLTNEALYNDIFQVQKDSSVGKTPASSVTPSRPVVGAPQVRTFLLTGLKQGTATFEIAYARSWEFKGWTDIDANIKHHKFTVTVE